MDIELTSATKKQLAYTVAKLEGFSVKITNGDLLVKRTAGGAYEQYSPVDNVDDCLEFDSQYVINHNTEGGITTALTYKKEDGEKEEIRVSHESEALALIYAYIKASIGDVISVPDQLNEVVYVD